MRSIAVAGLITLPLLLSACHDRADPSRSAAEDAKAIAMVEAAQNVAPPPVPLEPQPITAADIEQTGLYGVGCSLVPAAQPGGNPVVMAGEKRAVIKLAGRFVSFAADPGSEAIPPGARSHYVGKAQSLWFEKAAADGTRLGQDALRWDGRVTIRDTHDQLVYSMSGELVCTG
jgi:hypothetical protein